jgi:hypothetical protein
MAEVVHLSKAGQRKRASTSGVPESIREFVERGGNVALLPSPYLPWLAEFVVSDRRLYGMAGIAERHKAKDTARAAQSIRESVPPKHRFAAEVMIEESQRWDAWEGELIEDEALCERIEALLPRDRVEELLEDVDCELTGRTHELRIEHRWYRCPLTGEKHDGPAVVIAWRGALGRDPDHEELIVSPEALRAALDSVPTSSRPRR